MRFDDVMNHYGSLSGIARALQTTRQAVFGWKIAGRVPALRQLQIEADTDGKLPADAEVRAMVSKPERVAA